MLGNLQSIQSLNFSLTMKMSSHWQRSKRLPSMLTKLLAKKSMQEEEEYRRRYTGETDVSMWFVTPVSEQCKCSQRSIERVTKACTLNNNLEREEEELNKQKGAIEKRLLEIVKQKEEIKIKRRSQMCPL